MNKCKFLSGSLLLGGVLLSTKLLAADVCVSNTAEFAAQAKNLPSVVQQLPTMLTTDGFLVTAGLKIRAAGDKLKMEGYVWKPGDIYTDDAYIKQACFDGVNFNVTLEHGKSYAAKIKGDKSVSIQGITFEKSSDAKFAGIIEKVKGAIEKKTGVGSGSSGNAGVN